MGRSEKRGAAFCSQISESDRQPVRDMIHAKWWGASFFFFLLRPSPWRQLHPCVDRRKDPSKLRLHVTFSLFPLFFLFCLFYLRLCQKGKKNGTENINIKRFTNRHPNSITPPNPPLQPATAQGTHQSCLAQPHVLEKERGLLVRPHLLFSPRMNPSTEPRNHNKPPSRADLAGSEHAPAPGPASQSQWERVPTLTRGAGWAQLCLFTNNVVVACLRFLGVSSSGRLLHSAVDPRLFECRSYL